MIQLVPVKQETFRKATDCNSQPAVTRLAHTPGLGVDSAQQIIAEVGPQAASFDSSGQLASWVGCCPGREQSAAVSQ